MPKKQWTEEERKAFAEKMRLSRQQTKTSPKPKESTLLTNNNITLTPDQFRELVNRLSLGGSRTDLAAAPSMTPGVGLQLNPSGQVVGTQTKYPVDPDYYPNPVDEILNEFHTDARMRRQNLEENYFITWDVTSKPYQTKDNLSVREPTFHATLYANEFDDQGVETGRAIVIQTLHMNEDVPLAQDFAAEHGIEVTEQGMKKLMDDTRHERVKQWIVGLFYPPRNFELNVQEREEAIGGTVVKVVTKSNVKGFGNPAPLVKDSEIQNV